MKATRGLKILDTFTVPGSNGTVYTIERYATHSYCSCPSWKFKGGPIDTRVCKHIAALTESNWTSGCATAMPTKKQKTATQTSSQPMVNADTDPTGAPPPVALANKWDDQDPTGMLMSEKLDGMRCWWDGTTLMSRTGNPIAAPSTLVSQLPSMCLDGELFVGRGRFQECMRIVRCKDSNKRDWSSVRFVVFDAPRESGSAMERLKAAEASLSACTWASVLTHVVCTGRAHVSSELDKVLTVGGEGVMLKSAASPYTPGRSSFLMKVKRCMDAEAKVVGHEAGKGKHVGRLGALKCTSLDGNLKFNVGTGFSDHEREHPPPIGAVTTYTYQEQTERGAPRFPVFVRVRPAE